MGIDRSITFLKERIQWGGNKKTFILDGKVYPYFVHIYNCGYPPFRMTERAVELSLADQWLKEYEQDPSVIEIGAVTPYYWPRRVSHVVDPSDDDKLVEKRSLFDVSLVGRKVLSISTFEHIGTGEYRLKSNDGLVIDAVEKLVAEAERFLITIPVGYNKTLDQYLLKSDTLLSNTAMVFLKRGNGRFDNHWCQTNAQEVSCVDYCKFAKGLIVLKR